MDLLTEKKLKKHYSLYSVGFFLGKNAVNNFIGNYLKIFKKKNHFTNYKIIKLI